MSERIVYKGRSGQTLVLTYEFEVSAGSRVVAHGRHKARWIAEAEF